MRRSVFAAVLCLTLSTAGGGRAETPSCKASPLVTQPCFTVHARLFFANGTPSARLWPVGTRRLLGVDGPEGDAESEQLLPPNVRLLATRQAAGDLRPLMGTFRVGPMERSRPGWMRHVCIQSASHLVLDVRREARR